MPKEIERTAASAEASVSSSVADSIFNVLSALGRKPFALGLTVSISSPRLGKPWAPTMPTRHWSGSRATRIGRSTRLPSAIVAPAFTVTLGPPAPPAPPPFRPSPPSWNSTPRLRKTWLTEGNPDPGAKSHFLPGASTMRENERTVRSLGSNATARSAILKPARSSEGGLSAPPSWPSSKLVRIATGSGSGMSVARRSQPPGPIDGPKATPTGSDTPFSLIAPLMTPETTGTGRDGPVTLRSSSKSPTEAQLRLTSCSVCSGNLACSATDNAPSPTTKVIFASASTP